MNQIWVLFSLTFWIIVLIKILWLLIITWVCIIIMIILFWRPYFKWRKICWWLWRLFSLLGVGYGILIVLFDLIYSIIVRRGLYLKTAIPLINMIIILINKTLVDISRRINLVWLMSMIVMIILLIIDRILFLNEIVVMPVWIMVMMLNLLMIIDVIWKFYLVLVWN